MSEKHALRRAFLYATFAYERLRVRIRERLFRFGVYLLYAVSLGRAVCHEAARWSMFPVCSGTGVGCLSRSGTVEYVFCVQWDGEGYLLRSGSMEHVSCMQWDWS